ncbi:low molecular weight protein-tyrosine-phosphatase [Oceanisphaera sediminis]|uniref:protein-tyrosine-phosphatase n=1 Tax=Oceanisphaera sediminis TaxID=981381 RepID=A0ABP7DHR5_9GAMM
MTDNHLKNNEKLSVLIVCMGNICRSPTAEAVLRQQALRAGIEITIDSAGTLGYHSGATPDSRARAAGERRGYDFSGIQARQVTVEDFASFDMILAADNSNMADLRLLCPPEHEHKLRLLLSFSPEAEQEVPDPYYGGEQGFERVLDLVESACTGLLARLSKD